MNRKYAQVRWGMLGCGDVTEIKSGPGLQKANGSSLVAVMRRSGKLAADYAARHSVPRWYDSSDALINDPDVDAVYVAAPPGAHLDLAMKVCAAGKPCYVEKPMARSHTECQQMVKAFKSVGIPLFIAYYRRALPRFVKAKELIASGSLGTVTAISYRQSTPEHRDLDPSNLPWRVQAPQSGGGLFLDVGSHTLDILDYLCGPLRNISGSAANRASAHAVEDSVAMHFTTRDGVLGAASWNYAASLREDVLEITGTTARISMSVFGNDPVRLSGFGGEELFNLPNPPNVQQPLIQTIVDELTGSGVCPSTGESGSRTSAVMDLVLNDYYNGREDAFWERPHTWASQRT